MENFLLQHNGGTRNEIKSVTKNRSYIKYLSSIKKSGTLISIFADGQQRDNIRRGHCTDHRHQQHRPL
jgi:hypothetical protein